MKENDLRNFIVAHDIEYHNYKNETVIAFIPFYNLKEFSKLIGCIALSNLQVNCVLKDEYIALDMVQICEYFDLQPEIVFPDYENN
jgi:hypothetical protein